MTPVFHGSPCKGKRGAEGPEVEDRDTGLLALKMDRVMRQRWPSEGGDAWSVCFLPPGPQE